MIVCTFLASRVGMDTFNLVSTELVSLINKQDKLVGLPLVDMRLLQVTLLLPTKIQHHLELIHTQ